MSHRIMHRGVSRAVAHDVDWEHRSAIRPSRTWPIGRRLIYPGDGAHHSTTHRGTSRAVAHDVDWDQSQISNHAESDVANRWLTEIHPGDGARQLGRRDVPWLC